MTQGDALADRLERLELPFNELGLDPFGISRRHLGVAYRALEVLYRRYFQVVARGAEHIPARGRAMLVGNHSGGVALDGAMVMAACFLELDPPRLAQGMAERFLGRLPFVGTWTARCGHFSGLPEHAERLLEDDRLLLVFPEGARGTAKLYRERNSLVAFGTGFLRLAMKTRTPIVPFGFVGGGEAIPTVTNLYALGRLVGAPYLPVTPWLLPLPLPARLEVHFGAPLVFEGTGNEDDAVVQPRVDEVKARIAALVEEGRRSRRAGLARRA